MASAWGNWTSTSSSQQRFRLGIDYTVSGTRITITRYKVQAQFSINQGVTLARSGSMSGSVNFNFNTSGGVVNIPNSGGTINGSRGNSYTIGGRVNGIYNGLVPTISHSIRIPAAAPNTPAAPTISNIAARSARLNWNAPNNNGAAITQYGYRAERGGNFIDGGFTSGTSATVSGLEPNTQYGARVRAQNSAGWSSFSSFRYFTTDAVGPGTPGMPSVSNITATGMRVTWGAANGNGAAIQDYQVRVERGGSLVKSANTGTVRNATFTGLEPNTQYGVRVRARNAAGWGSYTSFRYFTTKVQGPTAPNNLTASRQNDSRINLSWNNRSSTARPYDTQQIQRRTNDGGWVTIANVSGSASTYADTGTTGNSKYEYAVRARNSAGNSSWAYSTAVYTSPGTPTDLVAEKDDDGNIVLTWVNTARYPTGYRIGHQTNGTGDYDLIETITGNVNTTEWVHLNPDPAVTHRYAIRATRGNLQSSLSVPSNTVQLQAPPDPPTPLGPEGPQDAEETVTLTWRHNPVDASRQRQAQVRWRVAGDSAWTTEAIQVGRPGEYVIPAGTWDNGTNIEWQVRTWGQDPDSSPWSATALITLSGKPVAGLIYPPDGGMVLEPTTSVQWSFFDPEGDPQSGWQVELLDQEGTVWETRSGSGTADQIILNTFLDDETTWTVRVRVRDSVGLWSDWDSSTFDVQYPRPVPPTIDLEWMEQSGNINVSVTNFDPATDTFSRVNEVFNPRGVATSALQTVRRNLITNPSFENGDQGIVTGTHATTEITNDVDGVFSGNQALAITVLGNASDTSASVSQFIDLDSAGEWQVAASLRVRRVSGTTGAARVGITFYDGSDNALGDTSYSEPVVLSTNSVRANPPLTHEATSLSGAERAEITLNLTSTEGNAPTTGIVQTDAWVADAALSDEPAPLSLPYLDGDSDVPQNSLFSEWTGEPNESTTVLQGATPDYWISGDGVYLYAQSGQEGMQVLAGRQASEQWIEPDPPTTATAGDQVRLGVDVTPRVPMEVIFGGEEFTPPVDEPTRLETTYIAEEDGPVDARLWLQPSGMTAYAWEGTPGESTSTRSAGNEVAHNYNWAGTFRRGKGGYTLGSGASESETSLDTEVFGPTGGQSLKVVNTGGTRNAHNGTLLNAENYEGTTIRAQAWVRTEPGATGFGASLRIGGAGVVAKSSEEVFTGGEWQLLTLDTEVNESGPIVMYLYFPTYSTTWFDSVRLGEPDDLDIFDGDTPDVNVPDSLAVLAGVDRMIVETGEDLPDRRDYFDGDTPNRSLPSGHQSIYYWLDEPYAGPSQADYVPSEETVYNDIYRSIDGGDWELVATHLPVNGNFLDRTNAVVGENCYYAVAWSALPSAARGETECITILNGAVNYCPPGEHSSLSAWVSGGDNYEVYCRAYFDLSIDEETGAETRTLHRFAGRTYPVEFSGRGLSQQIDLTFSTRRERDWRGEEISTLDDWRELLRLPGPHLLRTYKGHRFEVSVSPIQAQGVEGEIEECTLTLTRTAVDLTKVPDPEQGDDLDGDAGDGGDEE